mgnify:FL=1
MGRIIDALTGDQDKCEIPGHGSDTALPQGHGLAFTPAVERATAAAYERVKDVVPAVEWPLLAPYVDAINRLKAERNAVVLAHNYMTPDVFGCVGDIRGDRKSVV